MLTCKIETRQGRQTTTPHRPKDQDVTTKELETRRSTGLQKENPQIQFDHHAFYKHETQCITRNNNRTDQLFY